MTEKDENKLKGEQNYLGWLRAVQASLAEKGCFKKAEEMDTKSQDAKGITAFSGRAIDPTKEDSALAVVTKQVSLDILGLIPPDVHTATEILNWLKTEYGSVDSYTRKQELKAIRMIKPEPQAYFQEFNKGLARYVAAGGTSTDSEILEIFLEGLDFNFYKDKIREINHKRRTALINKEFIQKTREEISQWYDDTPKHVASASAATQKRGYEQRHCTICAELGRRDVAIRSHNTNDHRNAPKQSERLPPLANKASNDSYSAILLDTGATDHFFTDKPSHDYRSATGTVQNANGDPSAIMGTGTVVVGDLVLENVQHVPSFRRNLVSGTKLSRSGYTMTLDGEGFVHISKGGKRAAHGQINPTDNLLHLNLTNRFALLSEPEITSDHSTCTSSRNHSTSVDINTLHQAWAHCHEAMIRRTAKQAGITITGTIHPCEICTLSKSNQRQKARHSKRATRILDETHVDLQGPFPLRALDGTNTNIKFVDAFSGYIKFETIPDKSSASCFSALQRYKTRMETRTGALMNVIAVDQGTEFDGQFLSLIQSSGMTRLRADPYKHHLPSQAERANQTCTKLGRALLLASKLPASCYADAQATSAYVLNRMVHAGQNRTPYEIIYGHAAKIDHLVPFGSVCYSWIPSETRTKLQSVRARGRILGYGDDDSTDEIRGYKILLEDGRTIWSSDVLLDKGVTFAPLPGTTPDIDSIANIWADSEFSDTISEASDSNNGDYLNQDNAEGIEDRAVLECGYVPSSPPQIITDVSPDTEESQDTPRPTRNAPIVNYNEESSSSDSDGSSYSADLVEYLFHLKIHDTEALFQFLANQATSDFIPLTHSQAMACPEAKFWRAAEEKELSALKEKKTFGRSKFVGRDRRPVKSRWVYTKKFDENNNLIKFKCRLVAKGFTQVYGQDYLETFSPVAMVKSIRTLVSIAAAEGMTIHHMDVETAFLNSYLTKLGSEDVLLELPPGCDSLELGKVVKVFRALYGFKQSPREWNQVLDKYLRDQGFTQSVADPCIYYKEKSLYVAVYVDDLFICGKSSSQIVDFKAAMKARFKMSDLGLLTWYLGMHFIQSPQSISIDQTQYISNKLGAFNFTKWECGTPLLVNFQDLLDNDEGTLESAFPYRSAVGSLIHVMRSTRPDIAVAVSIVSRYLDRPTKVHCNMVRRIYQYLSRTKDIGLNFKRRDNDQSTLQLVGYSDASYANSYEARSISGYALMLGDTVVSWYSHTQPIVALSTAEAEYVALTDLAKEVVWMKLLLDELGYPQGTVVLREDNQAAIKIAKNPQDHKRTKHIDVRYHYIREQLQNEVFRLEYVPTESQLADMFTKGLYGPRLRYLCGRIGLQTIPVSEGQLNSLT